MVNVSEINEKISISIAILEPVSHLDKLESSTRSVPLVFGQVVILVLVVSLFVGRHLSVIPLRSH